MDGQSCQQTLRGITLKNHIRNIKKILKSKHKRKIEFRFIFVCEKESDIEKYLLKKIHHTYL